MDIRQPRQMEVRADSRDHKESHRRLGSARHSCDIGIWTGATGVFVATIGALLLRDWAEAVYLKTLAVLTLAALAMVAVDLLIYRVHLNPTTELALEPIRPVNLRRLMQKLAGFWLTIG